MPKSPDAFRTISEVADWLGVQAHVLRFWESKFSQVKPIKRAGGRRYYRPNDMLLLGGIKKLLHEDGMTIKGAQKLLREKGNAFVADLSQPLDDLTVAVIEGTAEDVTEKVEADAAAQAQLEKSTQEEATSETTADTASDVPAGSEPARTDSSETDGLATIATAEANGEQVTDETDDVAHPAKPQTLEPKAEDTPVEATKEQQEAADADTKQDDAPDETDTAETAPREKFEVTPPKPAPKEPPKPRVIDVGPLPDLADFADQPSALSQIARVKSLSPEHASAIQPLLARLTRLRASMASPRKDIGKD